MGFELETAGNDLLYITPPNTPIRLFKRMLLGRDIFEEGIIKQEEVKGK